MPLNPSAKLESTRIRLALSPLKLDAERSPSKSEL
jgi:hypothetical protein